MASHGFRPALVALSACLGLSGDSAATDPPFNAELELRGSAVFNSDDWQINGTGTGVTDAKVGLDAPGLRFSLDTQAASTPRIQFRRSALASDGVIWAWFRIKIDDVDNVGFYLGLYSEDSDPRSGEPTYAAYFRKDESDTQVDLRTRNNDAGNTVADQLTVSDNVPFDLVIKIDLTGFSKVTFYWRESPTDDWEEQGVNASAPPGTEGLHFSLLAFNDDGQGTSATLVAEVFEHDAPTRE